MNSLGSRVHRCVALVTALAALAVVGLSACGQADDKGGVPPLPDLQTVAAKAEFLRGAGIPIGNAGRVAAESASLGDPIFRNDWEALFLRLAESGDSETQVLHLDLECIEDDGDYVAAALQMARVANLTIESVKDRVRLEDGVARLSFVLKGKSHVWDFDQGDDYMHPQFFSNFQALVREHAPHRLLACIGFGQSLAIVCVDSKALKRLQQAGTGLGAL